jgi:hypothetical protein
MQKGKGQSLLLTSFYSTNLKATSLLFSIRGITITFWFGMNPVHRIQWYVCKDSNHYPKVY